MGGVGVEMGGVGVAGCHRHWGREGHWMMTDERGNVKMSPASLPANCQGLR